MKLNIGAGTTEIEGYTPIDRKLGTEAAKLNYEDNSIEEIRASHILEHFSRKEAQEVLTEWMRVLEPGGLMKIAVPDLDKLDRNDPHWMAHVMGGQTDGNDFHKSCYTKDHLEKCMRAVGLTDIEPWISANTDCAALPISLNLQGRKPMDESETDVKILTMSSIPRYGALAARGVQEMALRQFGLGLNTYGGVFWGQHMQKGFNYAINDGADWILTIDYDTMISPKHIDRLFTTFGSHPEIDCLASIQSKRDDDHPLMTVGQQDSVEITPEPFLVTTAHFGFTLIRVECLKEVPKPWFHSVPDENGEWENGKMDDDIYFWHKWREHGKNIYVDPLCNVGHLEEMVSFYSETLELTRCTVPQWRERFLS